MGRSDETGLEVLFAGFDGLFDIQRTDKAVFGRSGLAGRRYEHGEQTGCRIARPAGTTGTHLGGDPGWQL